MKLNTIAYFLIVPFAAMSFGDEFQVNTHTSNDQKKAAIAMRADGGFIVVWSSYSQDGSSNGIFGQRFDPNCNPLGEEFQINTTTAGNQTEPSVAMDADGNFIIAWQGPGLNEDDEEDIFAQRFDPNGEFLGDEFIVNTNTIDEQLCPSVSMNNKGAFIIVWESENIPEKGDNAICSRFYDINGERSETEFMINAEPSDCRAPDVAMDPNGNFAVVWMLRESDNSIASRLFNSDCNALTNTFEVSTIDFSSNTQPAIAMDVTGGFVVTWDGDENRASDDDIHARLFDPNGTPLGKQFIVNTILDNAQQNPQVAMNDAGEFVIIWDSRIDANINERDIRGQRFDSAGEFLDDEFLMNVHIESDQRCPDVAIGDNGRFVTVWQGDSQDGSRFGIFGRAGPVIDSIDSNGDDIVDF